MTLALTNLFSYGMTKFSDWKRANVGVLVIFIVAIAVLGALGLGVAAYCVYKGMSFDFALSMDPWTVKIGCRT